MIYDVNETRFYDIKDLKDVKDYSYQLLRANTLENIAYFNLKIELIYLSITGDETNTELLLPIELNTSVMEELEVEIKRLELKVLEEKGIDLDFDLSVNIKELYKEEIVESYQQELIENLPRNEEIIEEQKEEMKLVESVIDTEFNLFSFLINTYQKYKVIILKEEETFDKISAKYKIPLDKLYVMKKEGNRVITCDEE